MGFQQTSLFICTNKFLAAAFQREFFSFFFFFSNRESQRNLYREMGEYESKMDSYCFGELSSCEQFAKKTQFRCDYKIWTSQSNEA